MLLPVYPDFCTGIFLVFSIFFPTSSISLQLYMTFHIFSVITSLFFFSPLIWFFPLSPSSAPISYFFHHFHLLPPPCFTFAQSPPYFFPTFSHFSFPCDCQPAKKCYPHRLFSTLWSPTSLCKQAPPAAPPAPVNPETPKGLRGTCLPAGARGGLALPWKLK